MAAAHLDHVVSEQDYEPIDMMCIAAAREVLDGEAVLVGMGPPLLACAIAKLVTSPGMIYVTESGPIDWEPAGPANRAPHQIADPILTEGAAMGTDMIDALGAFVLGGNADSAMLQAAQVDRFGNLNTILVGTYEEPRRRLPGTGGSVDTGASAGRVISTLPLETRRFAERVDFLTTAGYIDGPGARTRAGLRPQGPNVCVTTGCVFRFDTSDGGETGSCEMVLDATFPGVTVEEVVDIVPWDLRIADDVKHIEPPTEEELSAINRLDADREHRVPGRYS